MENQTNSKLKSYLIEKLLNESVNSGNNNSNNKSSMRSARQSNDMIINSSESKEDLASETGTYTIDDSPDMMASIELENHSNNNNNNNNNTASININNSNNKSLLKQSVTSTTIDLISARAAIDEKFGIIKRPTINDSKSESSNLMGLNDDTTQMEINQNQPKRQPQKLIRLRNKTYSLTKDLFNSTTNNNINTENTKTEAQISASPTSSVSSSSSLSAMDNNNNNIESKIKKTTTYEVINEAVSDINAVSGSGSNTNAENSALNTSRTVGTDLLLGDTEKLIEQLKKRRIEKKQKLQSKLLSNLENINNGDNLNLSSASSTSSSSNNNFKNQEIQDHQHLNGNNETIKSQSWTIPNDIEDSDYLMSLSTRASVNVNQENIDPLPNHNHQVLHKGGMAFDFLLDDNKLDQHQHTPVINKIAPIMDASNSKSCLSSSLSSSSSATSSMSSSMSKNNIDSARSNMTITRGYELKSQQNKSKKSQLNGSSLTSSSFMYSPKSAVTNASNATSLGAKIQSKAKANISNNPITPVQSSSDHTGRRRSSETTLTQVNLDKLNSISTTSQYVNRTLYLRQQSAKAKRDSLEKQQQNSFNGNLNSSRLNTTIAAAPSTGILKKTSSTPSGNGACLRANSMNKSFTNLNSSSSMSYSSRNSARTVGSTKPSRANSRNTSPYNNSVLMTTSLNLPAGSALPGSSHDLQRKNPYYNDKITDQESARNALHKNITVRKMDSKHGNDGNISDSSMNSIYNEKNVNEQTYENILQSTLQRLCIRLIQMSTGVLDKIGDNTTRICDNLSSNGNTDLERMQQLAKLVHSMQLVHDHIQVIDSTLFNHKVEDSYIKELTKIRQEVDFLKQSASLNSSNNSSPLPMSSKNISPNNY